MSELTDEDKAKLVAGEVDEETQDENAKDDANAEDEKVEDANDESKEDQQSSGDDSGGDESSEGDQIQEEEESTESFEKKFRQIKGDTPDEYAKGLEKAYENSTSEFMKLREQFNEAQDLITRAKEIVDGKKDVNTEEFDVLKAVSEHPAIKRIEEQQQQQLAKDFAEFRESVADIDLDNVENFKKFEVAVANAGNTIRATENREPENKEMFEKAALLLGWSANKADMVSDAVKSTASSAKTNSGKKPAPKSGSVSDKEVVVARQFFPNLTDTEIREELVKFKS
jgi:hypothetical protein